MILKRIKEVKRELGYLSDTSVYNDVKNGLLSTSVASGIRAKAWPDYEVQAVVRARIAGLTNDEIRMLIAEMVAKRVDLIQVPA